MGRGPTNENTNMYFQARKKAATYNERLWSREGAAELLGISVSTLADYELGNTKVVPVDKVVLMADLYNAPELITGYCMRECPVHGFLPLATEEKSLEGIALSKNERSNIDSVLQVSVNANKQVYSLLRRQNEMCEALRELMKDEIEKELENKLEQGEKLQLIRQVIKKLQKGNSVEETADMLEEEPENIRKIYEIAATMAPDYDVEKIYQKL